MPSLEIPCLVARPDPASRLRLLCFHHAGGAASAFAGWREALAPAVDVLPVQLPGRETRIREPRVLDMDALVAELDRQLDPLLAARHAFYGHSLGALVAYDLVRLRQAAGSPLPDRLLVGACAPPDLPAGMVDLPDEELARRLIRIGGMSEILVRYPAWSRAALSLVRDDLRLCSSHRWSDAVPVRCPIHAFAGDADPVVSADVVAGWAACTTADFRLDRLPGGHLFIHETREPFLALVQRVLAAAEWTRPR